MSQAQQRSDLRHGTAVGRYSVTSVLSSRDLSTTYRARTPDGVEVILKELYPVTLVRRAADRSLQPVDAGCARQFAGARDAFTATALQLSGIRNRHIVRVLEVVHENNTVYMVLEFEQAFSLRELLRQTPRLDYEDIKAVAFPVLDAMGTMHRNGIRHLAIDLDTILVRPDGSPLLVGFGSVYTAQPDATMPDGTSNSPVNLTGTESGDTGVSSDIHALGTVLYTCVTGRPPVPTRERTAAVKAGGKDPYLPLSGSQVGTLAQSLLTAIDHAMALLPRDRPESISAWMQEFLALTDKGDITVIKNSDLRRAIEDEAGQAREQRYKLFMASLSGSNQPYYLAAFINQDDRGLIPRANWNTGAFLFGLIWMGYRRMWGLPLVVTALGTGVAASMIYVMLDWIPESIVAFLPESPIQQAALLAMILAAVLLGFWGNYVYYLHTLGRIRAAGRKHSDVTSQRKWLSDRGDTSTVGAAFSLGLVAGILALMLTTTNSRIRGAEQPILRALSAMDAAAWLVREYRLRNGAWPATTGDVLPDGYTDIRNSPWDISIYNQLLVLTFRAAAPSDVVPEFLAGRSLAYYGTESGGNVSWKCGSIDIPLELLPESCRLRLK